jgi:hypothetical protein
LRAIESSGGISENFLTLGEYLKKWPNFRRVSEVIPKINKYWIHIKISLGQLPNPYLRVARGSPRSVLLVFSQSYVEHDLRKNKILVPFFCQPINFYELIVRF